MRAMGKMAVCFYLAAIFLAVPLYYSDGYYHIGEDKFSLFFWSTLVFFILMLFARLMGGNKEGRLSEAFQTRLLRKLKTDLSPVDIAAAVYGLFILFSFFCSPYRGEVFFGEQGWHMGLVMRLFSLALYFLLSRGLKEIGKEGISLILLSSALIFFIGLLNRFGIRPLEMGGASQQFIGTIGNVDWFAGIWTMLFPIGLYAFLQEKKASGVRRLNLYLFLGISFCLVSGAQSSILLLMFYLFLAFLSSFGSNNRFRRFLRLMLTFLGSLWTLRLLRLIFRIDLEQDTLIDLFTDPAGLGSGLFWLLLTVSLGFFSTVFSRLFRKIRISEHKAVKNAILAFVLFLFVLYLLVILIRGVFPGFLPFLNGSPYFALNESFGSGRGRIWQGSLQMFGQLHPLEKLLGVGPDGYASFLYGSFTGVEKLTAPFGGARLTNGHSIVLTELINIGIMGTAAFTILLICYLRRQLKLFKTDPGLGFFLYPVCGYLLFGLFNFDMVLNYPYLFLFMAAGESVIRDRAELDSD